MTAHLVRFAIGVLFAAFAVFAWLRLGGWQAWTALVVLFVIGSTLAEWTFRRLATRHDIQADLEDRVRNPPP